MRPAVQRAAVGRVGVEVAERQHDAVDDEVVGRAVEHDALAAVGLVDARRWRVGDVVDDLDVRRRVGQHALEEPLEVRRLHEPGRERRAAEAADLGGHVGRGEPGERRRRRPSQAHSASDGPGRIGPAQRTDSSVNIVTSSAIEFIHSRGCWSGRQTRPSPRRCGSIEVDAQRARRRAARRWPRGARRATRPSGPAPTTASSRVGIEQAYVKVDLNGRDCVVAGTGRRRCDDVSRP